MVKCDICGLREAVVYQRHTGRRLCKECFFKDVLERVLNEVKRYEMFKDNDKIMLAVSGGKDSYVLMNIMTQIHDPSKLGAVTIVEGIKGYNRVEDLDQLRAYAKDHGIDIVVVSVKELSGYTVDEMVENSIGKGLKISPCTFCGIYRRRGINLVARSLGYDKVATAHNLDDEVQTLVINMLRGDEARLIMLHPKRRRFSELFVPKIKPLRKIYEYETARYAYLKGYKPQIYECPYLNMMPSLRSKIRDVLYRLEEERPGSLLKLLEEYDKLFEKEVEEREVKLNTCIICGEPTSPGRRVCKACELLIKTGLLRYEEKIL
ncbi:MAG: TIGR00269 family protein [Desulfurococcales archaeon]|jgi:uncharacterized protein (TIGR00269 family)|nr:TIGR00269 family protein [Desulfurococcales archaeon]